MTALAADKLRDHSGEYKESYGPCAASIIIYNGAMVATNAAGNIVSASDIAAVLIAGIADGRTNNSAGAAGDKNVEFQWGQVERIAINSTNLTVADVNKNCFVFDDQTVTNGATAANDVKVGRIKRIETGWAYVEVGVIGSVDA